MKNFKTTLKRSLSVFLVVLMMLTSAPLAGFVGIELPELSINADASTSGTIASYASTDDVIICVPETIYMSPTIGASVSGQYFVNNIVNSSGNVILTANRADTTGQLSIYAPGATAFSLNVTAAVGDIGDPVIGSSNTSGTSTYEGEIFNFTAFGGETGYVSYDGLYLYIDGAGVSMGSTASIKWAVTLTYDTGKVTYYAYSTLYTPHLSVGAVSESRRTSTYNNEISSWISGVTGSGARKSVSSDRVGDGGTTADGYLTYDPLLTSTFGVGSSDSADDYVTSSTTIKTAHAVAVNGAQWTRSVGYLGYLTIDSSRYTNINQIPNLTIGADALRVNDNKKDSLGSFNAWYVVGDSSYTIGTEEDSTPSGWTQFVNLSEPQATSRNTVVPSYAVSSINGLYIHTVSQGYCTYLSSKNYATACASVLCTTVNKADLRKLVLQCSSLNKANYAYDWDVFIQAYENAAYVLGNPAATEHDISKAINFFYALPSIAKWNSAFEAGNSIVNITLTSDIILDGAPHSCLSAIPAGVTVNLNMNGYNIQWFDVDAENEDIISTSYPLSNNYWGLITNNGTLNISGTGTISSYHIRYNNENSANQDNYGAKSAAIVNNGTLTIGANITVKNYIGQANTEGKNYQDMFIYSHGVYNTGTVYSAGDIYSGAFAMGVVGGTISSNGYVCAYSYGIFGGSVTTTGGHIYSEAKSGFYVDTPFIITKRGNKSGNFAVGIYSNDAELYGNTAITTKATSWRDDDSGYNIWRDGTNMSWGVGVMYSGNNYPYIGSAVNVDASFQLVADESTVSFPEYLAPIFYYSVNSNNGPETYDRRAYAVASVSNDLNAAMYGGQTAEILPWGGDVFGLSSSDIFTVTDYRSEYLSGGLETSTDNYTASGNNTNETLTSRLVNGYPASSGASLNINPYCATAAVEYARRYALAYNQEWHFYVNGGDCANYVSQALYAGGYQMTSLWHSYDGHYDNSEYYCYRTDEDGGNTHEWIRAEELRNYLVSTGGVQVHNPNKNDFSLGDAVFYDWDGDGEMDHSAIVTAIDNGTPKVSCHSTPEGDSKLDAHWTLGEASSCCYLIKLSGNTCNNDKANSYKYYLVNKATAVKSEVNSGSTLGTVYRYRTVRVISEYNGWGYINYLGKWGWVNLSNCTYKGSWSKIDVDHSMSGWYTYALPTCTNPGIMLNVCSKCGYTQRQNINVIAHKYTSATCTSASYCTMCGATSGSALGHDWTVTEIAPTCVKTGEKKSTCSRCGISKTETIATVDHTWGSYVTTTEPTCTKEGIATSTCSVCSKTQTKAIEALGHSMEEIEVDATCTVEGTTTSRCTRCGHTEYSDSSAALGHDYQATVTLATCTADGYTTYVCSRCNDTYVDSTSEWSDWTENYDETAPADKIKESDGLYSYIQTAWGHNFSVTDTADATCTEDGHTTQTCSRCNLEETEIMDALGHDWGEWTDNTDGTHSRICARDSSHIETLDHVWYDGTMTVVPTCETEGTIEYTCEICGGVSTEAIDPIGHDYYLDESMSVEPTCAEDGYNYYVCANNPEHNYKENISATGHNMSETVDYPPEGTCGEGKKVSECTKDNCDYYEEEYYFFDHSYGDTIDVPGTCYMESYTYQECTKCGSTLITGYGETDPDNHSDCKTRTENVSDPTCTEPGYTGDIICEGCGKTITVGEEIPALGHDWGDWADNADGTHMRICNRDERHTETTDCAFSEWVITKEPTCTETGAKERECSDCGYIESAEISVLAHDYIGVTTAPTCTEQGYTIYTCSECGDAYTDDYVDATDHDWGEWTTVTPATCEDDGLEKRICKNDASHVEENVLEKTGHDWDEGVIDPDSTCSVHGTKTYTCQNDASHTYTEEVALDENNHVGDTYVKDAKEPDCTNDGYTGDTYCSDCDKKLTDGEAIPATDHDWGNWETVIPATCEEDGLEKRICKNDASHVEENVLEKTGHDYVGITTAPNCTEQGYTKYTCSTCGDTYNDDYVDAIGHDWDDGVIDPSSTCTAHGTKTYTCQNDASHTYTEEVALDENNHVGDTYVKDAKEPDCTNDGYTGDTYCSDCDKKLTDGEVISALGHDMGEWYEVTKATCTEKGLEKRDCNRCDYYEERETAIDPDNHYAETFYTVDEKADCENDGKKSHHCECCDESLDEVVIPAREHVYDNGVETKAPTCTEDGVKTFTCTNAETEEYNACTHSYTEVISATGHDWSNWETVTPATCEDDGLEKRICKNDASHVEENVLEKTGHDYVIITIAPTCTEQGYTTYTCSECGDTYTDDYVDAHDHDYHLIAEKSKAADYGVPGYDYYECSYDASHNYTVVTDPLVKTTYTATFVVTAPFFDEDKTVGTVTFEQGDKYVDEPSVENYKNYTFAWDEYELNDEDVVIYGRYTEIEIDGVSDVETNKNATYNNGVATITLEAKSDTKNIKVLSENTKPVDVILVLDQSGSMAETLGGTNMTKQEALINCANSFVNEIYENAVATGADHRVALVGFAYSDYSNGNYENTGILATTTGKAYNYAYLTDTAYETALIPVVSNNGINKYITNGIKNVSASGATAADLGLEMANDIFAVTENDGTRERIVIFITDGTPTSWGETTDLVEGTSAAAITQSNRLKNQQGAKIYSVGVHANADPTANFTTVDSGVTTDNRNNFKSFDFNRFLHAVSSNYPESGSMKISTLGTGSKDGGYYMGVNDTSNLSDIFSKILYSAVYEINTFDKVTLVDTISKEFTLTLEQEAEMRENLTSTLGIKNEDISVIRNTDGTTTVKFTNVRATKVYNNDGSSYYSASVSFNVSADADSLRGGNIATNTEDAYVDLGGTNIGSFTVPTVNIEQNRNIVVFTINGVVYRIDEAKFGDNIVAPESELAKWNIAEGTLVTENCAYFEASEVSDAKYTVTWISEGKQEEQTYTFGSIITVPEAGEKTEYDFIKWSPSVPATMPACNMTFTAVYAPEHAHLFKNSYVYGDCEEGRTTVYVCSCGETKEETAESVSHTCEAVVTKTNNGTLVDRVSCTVCGKYVEQNLTYKVSYSQGKKTTVLDLTLYENEVTVQPDGTMKIMFYLGNAANKNYTVYRIDEDGTKTAYTPEKKNGYLIFDVDHFSIYVITEIDSDTQKPAEEIKYEQALCVLNGHSYTSEAIQATCTQNGYTTHTCSNCGDTYTTDEISAIGHADNNSDNKCDACGANVSEYCSCMCHKKGFLGFIWKILNFFYKLFGMNQTCDCGVAHW